MTEASPSLQPPDGTGVMAVAARLPLPPRRSRSSGARSNSSSGSSPERDPDDDGDSIMEHGNDSQSSLGVSLEEMELDHMEFEEKCRRSPISRLPPEILINIFSKLQSSPSDLVHCVLTCKSWARNSIDLLWHRPLTNTWQNVMAVITTAEKTDGYYQYNELIKRLNLAGLADHVADGTLLPLVHCNRIERLTLTDCKKLTDVSVQPLIEGNRSLVAIDVTGLDDLTDKTIKTIAKYCYRLQGLNITKCRKVTDDGLQEVARNCKRVRRLKFNECPQLTDLSVLAFAENCHDILEIDLHKCIALTDVSVTAIIMQAPQLRELRLAQCTKITDLAFLSLPAEAQYEALRILDLTDCNELGDSGLTKIIDAAPRLKNLVLNKCRRITDRGVLAITRLGKNLHYIHLGHCAQISDHGVSQLIEKCTRIRYIDLACCVSLTDDSVILLATLQKLKRIGLVKCANITDRSIKALAKPRFYQPTGAYYPSHLERLHLSYCTNLTINGVRAMLLNCPKLSHLSLTGVQEFLREDLLAFCRLAPPEFNEHQRDVFCVFSGKGVGDLRKHLAESYPTQTPSDAGSEDGQLTPRAPFAPQHGQFGGLHLASASFQPHQQAGHANLQSFPLPQGQLLALQHQLAQLQDLHHHHAGHHYAQQGGAPITVTLPPPPPPHTTQHFGVAHIATDGTIGIGQVHAPQATVQPPMTPVNGAVSAPSYAQVTSSPSSEATGAHRQSVVAFVDEDSEIPDAE